MKQEIVKEKTEKRFYTVNEVAERFGVHPNIIYRAIKNSELNPNIFGKHAIRFSINEIERYEKESLQNK